MESKAYLRQKKKTLISFIICAVCFANSPLHVAAEPSHEQVHGEKGMVVSSHFLATQVGVDILKKGGNAVDAAIATGFALAVVHPSGGNIGGGGFMIVDSPEEAPTSFDFRERAPLKATETMFLDENGKYTKQHNHKGYLSVGTPGTVAGFFLAHERFGRLPMEQLLDPAIQLADNGFKITKELSDDIRSNQQMFKKYPGSKKTFFNKYGYRLRKDDVLVQSDLANTLKLIRDHGRDGFYLGKIPELIEVEMTQNGGILTKEDFDQYEAVEREPLIGTYNDFEIIGMAPPSSGGVAIIQMLNILEKLDIESIQYGSAKYIHLTSEAMRLAFRDRARYIGDPEFNPDMPIQQLISKEYAQELVQSINVAKAGTSTVNDVEDKKESPSTTHYSVIDSDGMATVVTYTIEQSYGSKIIVDGTGFLLNNEMGDFNVKAGYTTRKGKIGSKANLVAPLKRMTSSMSPTIVRKNGRPILLIGSPGGRTIINTVLHVILNVVSFDMSIKDAIDSPRWHHQWLPDRILMEKGAVRNMSIKRMLKKIGHKLMIRNRFDYQGRAMGIFIDQHRKITGSADFRAPDGLALGY